MRRSIVLSLPLLLLLQLGDSVGDLSMCEGVEDPAAVVKIGFLNFKIEERLEHYLDLVPTSLTVFFVADVDV
jgi:hypothetical protein